MNVKPSKHVEPLLRRAGSDHVLYSSWKETKSKTMIGAEYATENIDHFNNFLAVSGPLTTKIAFPGLAAACCDVWLLVNSAASRP